MQKCARPHRKRWRLVQGQGPGAEVAICPIRAIGCQQAFVQNKSPAESVVSARGGGESQRQSAGAIFGEAIAVSDVRDIPAEDCRADHLKRAVPIRKCDVAGVGVCADADTPKRGVPAKHDGIAVGKTPTVVKNLTAVDGQGSVSKSSKDASLAKQTRRRVTVTAPPLRPGEYTSGVSH